MSRPETVGTLLADIANLISEALRVLSFSDKRQWGPDEHEQTRALQGALDEAKKDFQELSPLVNGQFHYEHDRKHDSIEELKALRSKFQHHVHTFKDWARGGGPIDPTWIRETKALQKELHRSQCRAARRVYASARESSARCLGAFLVHRVQRSWISNSKDSSDVTITEAELQRRYMEELAACNRAGAFERFGEHDIAFICDFCDGHMVWEDLAAMPTRRAAHNDMMLPTMASSPVASSTTPLSLNKPPPWHAVGIAHTDRHEKDIIFAPVVIASHAAPAHRDWEARLTCPVCEDVGRQPQEADDDEDPYRPDEEFDDVAALYEHMAWQHPFASTVAPTATSEGQRNGCRVM